MRCPTCKQEFPKDQSDCSPFCSRRCKMIDLGKWLDGEYTVPGEPASPLDIAREQEGGDN